MRNFPSLLIYLYEFLQGRIDKIKHVFSMINEDNLSPNLQSYAGYLEAFSNSKFMDVTEIQQVVNEMKTKVAHLT